jgi:outer membrane protein assembly factor BamB
MSGLKALGAFNLNNGGTVWKSDGILDGDISPSPIHANGLIIAGDGGQKGLFGFQASASGAVSPVWTYPAESLYVASPVADPSQNLLMAVTNSDKLIGLRLSDGKPLWSRDLTSSEWFGDKYAGLNPSPVLAGGKLYILNTMGTTLVADYSETGASKSSLNSLNPPEEMEEFWASMAVAKGRLYIRGSLNLYCIGY